MECTCVCGKYWRNKDGYGSENSTRASRMSSTILHTCIL